MYMYFFAYNSLTEANVEALTLKDIDMEWWDDHELWVAHAPCNIEAEKAFDELNVAKYIFDSWFEG